MLLHATAFGARLLGEVAVAAGSLQPGAWLVCVSKSPPGLAATADGSGGGFELCLEEKIPMEYGPARVFFYRRLATPPLDAHGRDALELEIRSTPQPQIMITLNLGPNISLTFNFIYEVRAELIRTFKWGSSSRSTLGP